MTGTTYVMSQVDQQDVLHPDSHLEFNDSTAQPVSAVAAIMTQLYFKVGLKQWGDKAKNAIQNEMKSSFSPPLQKIPASHRCGGTWVPSERHPKISTYTRHQLIFL